MPVPNRKIVVSPERAQSVIHLRQSAGWTQEALAKAAGVSLDDIKAIEAGKHQHSPEVLLGVQGALNRIKRRETLAEAKAFLQKFLADGPKTDFECAKAATTVGIYSSTLIRATKQLVRTSKVGDCWQWGLLTPEPTPTTQTAYKEKRGDPSSVDWDNVGLGEISDYDLSQKLGVALQTVEKERRKRKLKRPDIANANRRRQIDWDVVAPYLGNVTDDALAGKTKASRMLIATERERRGIPTFNRRIKPMSLDGLTDAAWYVDERSLWDQTSEVAKALEQLTSIRPIELLQRFKLSTNSANLADSILVLETLGWKKHPGGLWEPPRSHHPLSPKDFEKVDARVLALLTLKGEMHTTLEIATACNLTRAQTSASLVRLENEKKITSFGQTRARRYLAL